MEGLLSSGTGVLVPEISDYEVQPELLRAERHRGLRRLDALKTVIGFLPITTPVMLTAAEYWATARKRGRPATRDEDIDCDMILAAQATHLAAGGNRVVVATMNTRHFELFVDARHWRDIKPDA
jgi:predicted nucleic acid-binding protein